MSHRDPHVRLNVVCLQQCLRWLLTGIDWSGIGFRQDCRWTPKTLVASALLWAWSDEQTLGERFHTVRKIAMRLAGEQHQLAKSYQAFTKILRRWTDELVLLLQIALHERMQQSLPQHWRVAGFILFGVDGSRIELPRTRSHEQAYSSTRKKQRRGKRRRRKRLAAKHAQKANSPQLWLTTMWHAGTGLPWDWRTGPADSSERAHMRQMLSDLPAGALVAADAGFVGYEGLQYILAGGRELLLRVGSNVRLLKKLGWARERAGTVYLWPDQAAHQGQAPLVLRLVVAHNGKHPVYLVTSVRSHRQLSDRQIVELYAKRWGIELFYRHLKQTFRRRKLLSTSAANARVEIEWSLVGLWAMALYALVEATKHKVPPERLSFAKLLLAFRRTLRDYLHPTEQGERLCERLRWAIIDSYIRKNKASRNYPRKKQERAAGPPVILQASRTQIRRAKEVATMQRIRLTA
jgi:Transposase DDE domain